MWPSRRPRLAPEPEYVELRVASNFSFLRGASHPEELVERAAALGYSRFALTDHDGLYGVVRAHGAGKPKNVTVLVGCELHLGAQTLLLYPTDRAAYGRLCRLLTIGRRRVGKGGLELSFDDLAAHAEGLYALHLGSPDALALTREKELFGDRLGLAIERTLSPFDRLRIESAQSASARFGVPLVATGGVAMHERARKPLLDIVTCIRLGVRLEEAGRRLLPNGLAYFKSRSEIGALFSDFPEAVKETLAIAERLEFRLEALKQNFTLEVLPEGETGPSYLRALVEKGASERYPQGVPSEVRAQIEHELSLIQTLDFAGYFLTVWDIVRWARSRGILCQGRGSAANSVVCYCLGITAIDPVRMNLLFERFISVERGEPPDIDVDFEHDRREEVMQYVYSKYGREHAAMVANLICFRGKLAYREVGKVFGLGEDQIEKLSRGRGHWSAGAMGEKELREAGVDPRDRTVRQVVRWAEELQGFPRHLGLHSGGFVITRDPLVELVPVENATMEHRTVVSWDKRDIELLGLVKVDLLALGMLSAVRRSFDYVEQSEGVKLSLADVPAEVPAIYDMVCDADTVGTFQVESRAQMQMLPRLKPRTFYDLVVSVAIVRPGPIQGDMIHPYLRRRDGLEPVEYPHPAMKQILGKTYGIPLFQEQVMKMAVAVAGFTPGEADELRRAIGWQSQIHIDRLRERLISGMKVNGLSEEYAERIFKMIQGFGGYGFPESHAASFALIGYASCYLKRYHPAAFLAGLLDSQPMGFYSPHTLVADAQRHGVEVRLPTIHDSDWGCTLEAPNEAAAQQWWSEGRHAVRAHTPYADAMQGRLRWGVKVQPAVRLGLKEVFGLSEVLGRRIVRVRQERAFSSIADFVARAEVPRPIAARLAAGGAMSGFGVPRRVALWKVMALHKDAPLLAGVELPDEGTVLPTMTDPERMRADFSTTGVSTDLHPMALVRDEVRRRGILGFRELRGRPHGERVRVAGLVVTRQRPGTASGVVFMTLEDEDGHMNLVVYSKVYERERLLARDHPLLIAEGEVQRTGEVVNVVVRHFHPLDAPDPSVGVARNFF